MLDLSLPYPPSVNHYFRMVEGRVLVSREGRRFRQRVTAILAARGVRPMDGRLALAVEVRPPDRRRRDLDNLQKSLLDALERGGAYEDDSQVDLLVTVRRRPVEGGACRVRLDALPLERCPLCGAPHVGPGLAED